MKQKKALKILTALSQETRLAIFRLLIQEGKEGLSAGTVAEILQVPAATLSFHLAQLSDAGVLKSEKNGRTIMYKAKYKSIKSLMEYLTENSFKKRKKAEKAKTTLN
ncbi:MAG: ArsR family transcriptional regulator [Rickettsiaceae bacterium]|jgi:DNA-binding transcriptional ArsR family regulator|nr:ArsR family transcriptional regulator [Rickettsiaceae bacterium]